MLPPSFFTALNALLVTFTLMICIARGQRLELSIIFALIPFFLIVVVGLASGATNGVTTYAYLKDAWYTVNPALILISGFILFSVRPDLITGLQTFMLVSVFAGIIQLRPYLFSPSIILLPTETIRGIVGTGSFLVVLGLVITTVYIGTWRKLWRFSWIPFAIFTLCALSVASTFSRSGLLVVVIAAMALAGCFARREWLRLGVPVLLILSMLLLIQSNYDVNSDSTLKTFGGKLARVVTEITVDRYSGVREANLNFRGFETAQALKQFSDSELWQMIFGQGYGAKVDLGISFPIELNEVGARVYTRHISWLHNGYMFLLTKGGLFSLALLIGYFVFVYRVARRRSEGNWVDIDRRHGRLLSALIVSQAATTYIIGGVFSKGDLYPFLLLTGYLLAALTHHRVDPK